MAVTWHDWSDAVAAGIKSVSDDDLATAAAVLAASHLILVAGNGGSAALASHAAQALMKPDYAAGGGRATVCLTDMTPTLTAHANDGGWETALEATADPFFPRRGLVFPTLLLFSSSGQSKNIIRLAHAGRVRGCKIVAFTGFGGVPLSELATVSLHVASNDYEVIEPVHDALMHRVQYHVRNLRDAA